MSVAENSVPPGTPRPSPPPPQPKPPTGPGPRPRAVHPVAALFPMLAVDELAELAEDIKQRGLLQPVMLDGEGRVLDGRNRLAACELVGVEPRFETFDGADPAGYARTTRR